MNRQLTVSYETIGASSYMTITCPAGMEPVHYQMEMMLSNDIKNLLAVSRQVMDGETVIYYNITSQIALSQFLGNGKLKRKELLNLVEGAVQAIRDASGFGLPEKGIMMEMDYIYVNPASCKPEFLYVPVEDAGGWTLKELLSDLVLHDRIAMGEDNLVQVLLRELNSPSFSIDQLENSLKPYRNMGKGSHGQKEADIRPANFCQSGMGQPAAGSTYAPQTGMPQIGVLQSGVPQSRVQPAPYQIPGMEAVNIPQISQRPETSGKEPKTDKEEKSGRELDAEKAKKKFMLPQALVLVVTAACISFGVFVDANGGIQVNHILAFLIAVGMAEVILYREIYINSKPKNQKEAGKAAGKKTVEKKRAKKGGKPGRPLPPGRKPDSGIQEGEAAKQTSVQKPGYEVQPAVGQPGYGVQPAMQQPVYGTQPVMGQSGYGVQPLMQQPGYGVQPFMQQQVGNHVSDESGYGNSAAAGEADTDIGSETEVWDDGIGGAMPVYLEYYENSQMTRIPMDRPDGIIIGRLEGQVDFVVKNPKVGKIHARFYIQGNQCFVVDINSKNGTYINGNRTRIESNTPFMLHDRDRITLANAEFVIHCQNL